MTNQKHAKEADNLYTQSLHIPAEYLNDTSFTPRADLSSSKLRAEDTIEEPAEEDMPEELAPE